MIGRVLHCPGRVTHGCLRLIPWSWRWVEKGSVSSSFPSVDCVFPVIWVWEYGITGFTGSELIFSKQYGAWFFWSLTFLFLLRVYGCGYTFSTTLRDCRYFVGSTFTRVLVNVYTNFVSFVSFGVVSVSSIFFLMYLYYLYFLWY